ncbi:MAG: Ig-like domain-containing protein, partial [Azonexus sp.]|nr:Ig-like domain-containing protein [Azonexus sp.]
MIIENSIKNAEIVRVAAGQTVTAAADRREAFVVAAHRADVANFARDGNDLVIAFKDGSKIRIKGFAADGNQADMLVFLDGEAAYWVDFGSAWGGGDGVIEALVQYIPIEDQDVTGMILAILGGITAALASDDDDGGGGGTGVNIVKPSPPPQAPTNVTVSDEDGDGKPEATGKAEPGSKVTVSWPDGSTSTTMADNNGDWTVEAEKPQTSGDVTVKASNEAGEDSPEVTIPYSDITPPQAPTLLVNDPDGDGKINASGTAEPGSTVTVSWPDGTITTTTADNNGNWLIESPAVQGSGEVKAKATDAAGNDGPSTTATWDTAKPQAPTISVNDADADGRIDAAGTAEPGAEVTVTWPDGTTSTAAADENGDWSVESPTVQGSGDVTASADDQSATATWNDTVAPQAPTLAVGDPDGDGRVNASGTAEPNSTVTVTWPDGTTSTAQVNSGGTWSIESPSEQPSGTVTATAKDAAGNESGSVTAQWDTNTPPAVTVSVGDPDQDGRINAAGTAERGAEVTVAWPDGSTSTTTADSAGNWSVESPTPQTSGNVTASAKGDSATAYWNDTVAPQAPLLVVSDPDDDGMINTEGTAEPGSKVTVSWPDGTTSTTTADNNGNWSIESPTAQDSGEVKAKATDVAGNDGPSTTATWDAAKPQAPTISVDDPDGDGRINAAGTAEPGSEVTVTWPDGTTSTAMADENGDWSVESPTVQGSGDVTASADGQSVTTTWDDTVAPQAPTLVVGDPDGDGKVTASGTAEPDSTVAVLWPDGTTSTAQVNSGGTWSVESPNEQPSGTVTATATDEAGNESDPATAQWDTSTPPVVTVSVGDPDQDGRLNAVGTAEPKAEVTVTWPDGSTST